LLAYSRAHLEDSMKLTDGRDIACRHGRAVVTSLLILLGGLALLVVGGELLVRGSVRLAERWACLRC
jgi:hypothetical protein